MTNSKPSAKPDLIDRMLNDNSTIYDLKLRSLICDGSQVADSVTIQDTEIETVEGIDFDSYESENFDCDIPPRVKRLY